MFTHAIAVLYEKFGNKQYCLYVVSITVILFTHIDSILI